MNEKSLSRFTETARKAVRLKGEVSILLTSSGVMRRLNRCFRGKDQPTDVISFPAIQEVAADFAGDLAISIDIARTNARRLGHSADEEVRVLILHGLLHLAGYDHENDRGEMAKKELALRRKLGLSTNLIARTESENGSGRVGKKAGRKR